MRCAFGSFFPGEAHGSLDTVVTDLPWRSRPHFISYSRNPTGDKTIPPHTHGEARGAQLGSHRGVVLSTGALQNNAGAKGQGSRAPRLLQQTAQGHLLF